MKSILFTFFMLYTFTAFSQTTSLKVYSNFLYPNSERYIESTIFKKNNGFEFEHFTLAFRKEKEKTFWEYEVGFVLFNETSDFEKLEHIDGHIRVERGFKIRESSNGKFKAYVSPSLKAYYLKEKETPSILTTSSFPRSHWVGGINAALFFRGQFHFAEKWYLDINTSFLGGHLGVDFQTVENPILTERQQTQGGFDFDIFHERIFRIGLGYNISQKQTALHN